jgi:hypothetical protein
LAIYKMLFAALPIAFCAYFIAPAQDANTAEDVPRGDAPLGAWRTTNECFLALIYVSADGSAQAAYLSGEHEDDAAWSWDGTTLTIIAPTFPQDSFTAQLADGGLAADYVWHELDTDMFHTETCLFEKVTESEISASL